MVVRSGKESQADDVMISRTKLTFGKDGDTCTSMELLDSVSFFEIMMVAPLLSALCSNVITFIMHQLKDAWVLSLF